MFLDLVGLGTLIKRTAINIGIINMALTKKQLAVLQVSIIKPAMIGPINLPPELNDMPSNGIIQDKEPGDEASRIIAALEKSGWNKSRAARILGISRRTIYRKMEELGIEDEGEA